MRLELESDASLPRLAWCAHIRKGYEVVHVRHGVWVETSPGAFVEGAWDGPFEQGRFDTAAVLAGSGGRLVGDAIVFAAPSHVLEKVYALRAGDDLHVSNSLAFALVAAGDEPDIDHPRYLFDLLGHFRSGLGDQAKQIRTRRQRAVRVHDGGNIVVAPDLVVTREDRPAVPEPADYATYAGFLDGVVRRVSANAAHPARRRVYRLLTAISRGYDSTAVSVLARGAGCREAVTFRKSASADGYVDDDGTRIGDLLGLQTTEYDRAGFLALPGIPDAEFYLDFRPTVTDRAMAVMASQLEGALFLSARDLVHYWSARGPRAAPLLASPGARAAHGTSLGELRLRTGFLHFPVPYAGAIHSAAVRRISESAEMAPWSVGGEYDRPIPRRIAEAAGVPRELFGWRKQGGGDRTAPALSAAGARDFRAFCAAHDVERRVGAPSSGPGAEADHPMWRSPFLYVFHWGFGHLKERYAAPGPPRSSV